MRLTELMPQFLRYETRVETWMQRQPDGSDKEVEGPREYYQFIDRIEDAPGVEFLCPKCFAANGGKINTHGVICWSRSRGVPDSASPGPGRWKMEGSDYGDLTLNADPPGTARSVQLTGGCAWHGFVTNGDITGA